MTTPITKFVTVSTRLATKVVPAATFENGLFLGCDEDTPALGVVPPDRRYISVTKDDFADYLAEGTEEYEYALGYFSQDYTPDALIIGRTFQAASAPFAIISGGVAVAATFEAIGNGYLKFEDSDGNEDEIGPIDFDGVTSYAQVLAKINAALAALVFPNIPGLDDCTMGLDNLGRLYLACGSVATAPYTKLSGGSQTASEYTGVTTGKIKFTDDATVPNTVEIGSLDFHLCTTFPGTHATTAVLGVLNAAVHALVAPAITGLELGSFGLDSESRLYFSSPSATGATARTISFVAASGGGVDLLSDTYLGDTQEVYEGMTPTGAAARTISIVASDTSPTDLFVETLLGDTCVATAGVDIESLTTSLQALQDLVAFYNVATYAEDGDTTISDAQYLALAAYIETQVLQLDFLTHNADAKDALVTTDLVSLLKALNLDRTTCYYTEQLDQRPDGANAGYVFPQAAGSCSFAYNTLSGVSESGLTVSLTSAQMTALDTKHVIYMCQVGDACFAFKSLTCSGEEKRVILGIDWFNATCQIDIINDRLVKKIHTFDYNTFGAIESILYRNAQIAYERNLFYARDDKDYPFSVDMPDPVDFSAAEKKTHIFDREVFHGFIKSEILNWQIAGTIEI